MWARVALTVLALSGCGQAREVAPELSFRERYPTRALVRCETTEVEHGPDGVAGEAVHSRSESRCSESGSELVCVRRDEGAEVRESRMVQRIDAAGIWNISVDDLRYDPPYLEIPADVAPGKSWSVASALVGADGAPFAISRAVKVVASERCDGGLLFQQESSNATGTRRESEWLLCPGMNAATEGTMRTWRDGKLVNLLSETCRAE